MKGVSFQSGVEFKIIIEGESWQQGDVITGTLESSIKNPGVALDEVCVVLAEGTDKRVKEKAPKAYDVLAELSSSPNQIMKWSFPLQIDSPIADTIGSLYILYGNKSSFENLGHLRLNVLPHHQIKDLIDTFVTQFRFALKKVSSGKNGTVEAKLDPPTIKDWASLEQVLMKARLTEDSIEADFIFTRQQVDASVGGVTSKTVKIEVVRAWPKTELIHDFNQRLNKDAAQAALEDVIAEYRESSWIGKN